MHFITFFCSLFDQTGYFFPSFKATHPSQKPAFNLSALPQSLFVFVENRPLPPVSRKRGEDRQKKNPSFSNQPIHCRERRLVERLFPDLDRQGQIPSPLVIHCGNSQLNAEETGLKSFEGRKNQVQRDFWAAQTSKASLSFGQNKGAKDGAPTFEDGLEEEGNSIFASPPQIPICIRREERRRGKLSSPLTLSSPTKKASENYSFPLQLSPPPSPPPISVRKTNFLYGKWEKKGGAKKKSFWGLLEREKYLFRPPIFCFFFCLVQKWAKQVSRELEILPRLLHLFVQNPTRKREK